MKKLGFGCMRLPHKEHFYEIDEVEAAKMFDYAIFLFSLFVNFAAQKQKA